MSRFVTVRWLGACLVVACSLAIVQPASAQSSCVGSGGSKGEGFIEEYVPGPEALYNLEQPFGGKASVKTMGEYVQLVYQFALGIVGIFAVVLIMYGGLRWVAAAGNESTIGEAKEVITSAVIGLVIALLSYVILLAINPNFVNTDVNVIKIPIPTQCSTRDPVVTLIPATNWLLPNSHQLCPNAAKELERIANYMQDGGDGPGGVAGTCPGCKIGVSSGVRTHAKQAELRSCYERAVANGVTDGSSCPSDCKNCNAACPVCTSNHEGGTAVDLWLQDYTAAGAASTSAGFASGAYNPPGYNPVGKKTTPALALNQNKLKDIMVNTPNSKFKSIGNEWWHFELKDGVCGQAPFECRVRPGTTIAANAYCTISNAYFIGFGDIVDVSHGLANCDGKKAVCPPPTDYFSTYDSAYVVEKPDCPEKYHISVAGMDAKGTPVAVTPGVSPACVHD